MFDYPKLTTAQAAYLAGIIDGEGYLGWQNPGRGHGRPRPAVEVSSTDEDLIVWLHETARGYCPRPRPASEKRKTEYRWRIGGHQAVALLKQVAPFLVMARRRERAAELMKWY